MARVPVDLVRAAARNLAAWHESSVAALGITARRNRRWWTCELAVPSIWFTAITLDASATDLDRPMAAQLCDPSRVTSVCDSFCRLDLGSHGLARERTGEWFTRLPGPLCPADAWSDPGPAGLRIESVRHEVDLEVFERTTVRGFDAVAPPARFDIHAPAILRDRSMSVWLAYLHDVPVASAMAYDHSGVRGIYGVATLPEGRRQGVATALTRHAIAERADLAVTLQPSVLAAGLYRSLGFEPIGEWAYWV